MLDSLSEMEYKVKMNYWTTTQQEVFESRPVLFVCSRFLFIVSLFVVLLVYCSWLFISLSLSCRADFGKHPWFGHWDEKAAARSRCCVCFCCVVCVLFMVICWSHIAA